MSINKTHIVEGLHQIWEKWSHFGSELNEAQWETLSRLPGWTVKDNLAHLVGGEYMLSGRELPKVEVSAEHVKNPVGEANEKALQFFREKQGNEVLTLFDEIKAERYQVLTDMSEEEFQAIGWTPAGEAPYGRFMQIRVYDAWLHLQDCREPLEIPGDEDGLPAEIAIDEVSSAMGYVVGKKGGAPEGSRVQIVLSEPIERTLRVEVKDGRALLVESFDGEPTSTLTLSSLDFTALTGGRDDSVSYIEDGRVILGGDLEVARRIAENLAYTI
jgi:uncharacterized protein (TIGR03083 family)